MLMISQANVGLFHLHSYNRIGVAVFVLCELPRPWLDGTGDGRGSWRGGMVLERASGKLSTSRSTLLSRMRGKEFCLKNLVARMKLC